MEGAIARVARNASQGDAAELFQVLDQRARSAMYGLFKARREAAGVIQESYPEQTRAQALLSLGDAYRADSVEALFAQRCPEACMDALAMRMASPKDITLEGDLAHVVTVRGEKLELFRGKDGRYGLVWNTEALQRESARAYAELDLIQKNAAHYKKQQALK